MANVQTNAWLSVLIGIGIAILVFVPVVALSYRRSGSFSPGDLVRTVAVSVYVAALGTYTLLPLPDRDHVQCSGRQTEPFRFLTDIHEQWNGSVSDLLRNPAFLQVALNVLLFVPLGWFVRTVLGGGIVVATALGLAGSLAIETTQATGLWGIYPCAYRVFDVDDLIVNTAGAMAGAVISRILVGRRRRVVTVRRPVTTGRRLVALVCDGLVVLLGGAGVAVLWRAWSLYGLGVPAWEIDTDLQAVLQYGVPFMVQAVFVLVAGRTVGEWATELDTRSGRLPVWLARPLKLVLGVGAFMALAAGSSGWLGLLFLVFCGANLVFAFVGGHRGLANTLAGLEVVTEGDTPPGREPSGQ